MEDHAATTSTTDGAYAAPAIERREDVKGVLGKRNKGSYCPPGYDD